MPKVISEGYCKTVFFERSAFALEVGNTSRIRKVSDRNRSKFEIIAEVLKELRTPSGKTNIMSQCNMSFAQSGH